MAAAAASSLAPCAPASQHRRVTTRTRGASGGRARLVSIKLALTPAPAPSKSPCCFVQEGQPTAPRNLRKRGQGQTAGFARGGLARDVRPRPDEYCPPNAPTTRFPAQTLERPPRCGAQHRRNSQMGLGTAMARLSRPQRGLITPPRRRTGRGLAEVVERMGIAPRRGASWSRTPVSVTGRPLGVAMAPPSGQQHAQLCRFRRLLNRIDP